MKLKVLWIMGTFLLLIFIYNYIQITKLYVNKPIFNNKKLSDNLRITQISDFHANKLINLKKLLSEINKFNPHIIVLTGDIIDRKTKDIQPILNIINDLMKMNKNIFYVSGNHELSNTYGEQFVLALKEIGVTVLDNNNKTIDIDGQKINICGLNFFVSKGDYKKAVEGIDEKNYTILLSHSPNRPLSYMSGVEDLILAGHTHGGQVRLPFVGAVISPGQGYFPKYDKGTFEIDDTILYIDSGLGNSLFPIRFLNRVQISNITITP